MNDRTPDRPADTHPLSGKTDRAAHAAEPGSEDVEGHSATIYRRRRGPYPLRHGAPLPDADDRRRGERQPPAHRAIA